jgi:tight adherence protein C
MNIIAGIAAFAALFGVCVTVASLVLKRPSAAAVTRVLENAECPAARERPRQFSWVRIPRLVGGALRKSGDPEKLKQDFVRAGIRSPNAEAVFNGVQVIASVLGLLLLTGVAILADAQPANTIMCALGGGMGGFLGPGEFLRRRILRRRKRISKALPNALDLLTIGVEAGLGLDQAIVHVSKQLDRAHPEISEELNVVHLETRAGRRRADALRSLAERTGAIEVRKLVAVLIQADRFGTSIAQSLRSHSEHLRVQARQTAEEKAAKLGVKLVFPIFFFILPALFVVTVGPVIVRIVQDLLPMMNNM